MFENLGRLRLVAVAAPISVAMGMTLISTSSTAGYLTSTSGVVTNGYGECWQSAGGVDEPMEACGDAIDAMDSDGDGVPDDRDRCPNTPRGVEVDSSGCPLDSDGDGVPDYLDKCPGTPAGAKVDSDGCEIIGDITINVTADHFAFDSAELKPAMMSELDDVATRVRDSKGDERLMIVGHTDSTGPEAYNLGLSERRADAAAAYLMQQGVASDRITTSGRGESDPIADNSTREGRSMNRRVEIQTQ